MYEVVSFVRKFLTSVLLAGLEREKHSGQTRGWRRGGGRWEVLSNICISLTGGEEVSPHI